MQAQDSGDGHVRLAVLIMLSLALFAGVCVTLMHWLSPVHRTMDMIVPPTASAIFGGLIVTLLRRPRWVLGIARIALVGAILALAAPAWFYTLQAGLVSGVQLVAVLPPVSSLFVVLLAMLMIFMPGRQTLPMALISWILIALPVLAYLVVHPQEMLTPRGRDLLMAYGPVSIMVVVLLPVQRGLSGTISRLALERARMEVMLHRDPLTGIQSRRLGERVLREFLDARTTAGVIMLDLDRFKAINDTHGHPVGDRVLQAVAERCVALLREGECMSRWGGEEFLVVVPDIDGPGLLGVAERLRSAIADLPVAPVRQVTASFGAVMIGGIDDLASVLQRVDQALYRAKRQGGNCVVGDGNVKG